MAIIDKLAVIALAVLAAAALLMFLAVIAATVFVAGAVRTEERRKTLAGPPPGPCTRLARCLLVVPDVRPRPVTPLAEPVRRPAWFELATGPRYPEVLGDRTAEPFSTAGRSL